MYPDGQEHRIGDLVIVKKGFWGFEDCYVGKKAVIDHTHASRFGGNDHENICLVYEDGNSNAWWNASKLKLISRDCSHLLKQWKEGAEILKNNHSNIDFIFSNFKEVIDNKYPSSIQALFSLLGCGSLWGSRGEGFVYQQNATSVLRLMSLYYHSTKEYTAEGFKEFCHPCLKVE